MRRVEGVANHLAAPSCVTLRRDGDVAVLEIDNPPVNALSRHVQHALLEALKGALRDASVAGVVVQGRRTFVAGADIKEMGTDAQALRGAPSTEELFATLEQASKPVVAAITGYALGGGLELSMMCNGRVTHASAKLGLPEQSMGLIPGWGGAQRLPRLVGVTKSLEMILRGQPITGKEATELGLADQCCDREQDVGAAAVAMARGPLRPTVLSRRLEDTSEDLLDMAQQRVKGIPGVVHPQAAIDAIRACVRHNADPQAGLAVERQLLLKCAQHPAHSALRHVFLAQRECARVPDLNVAARPLWRKIAVIGAGKMGSGIALSTLLETDSVAVIVKDIAQQVLDACELYIKTELTRKGKSEALSRLRTTLNYADIAEADCVIEAATEQLSLKQGIFRDVLRIVRPTCILATNTSSIDLLQIGSGDASLQRRLVGSHFFNPPSVMPLLEIVRTVESDPQVVADWIGFAKALHKVPLVVRNCVGFTANRTFFPYGACATWLISKQGVSPYELDKALMHFGMPIGTFALSDLVGLDVGMHVSDVRDAAYRRMAIEGTREGAQKMVQERRLGRSTGRGWYLYEKGSRKPVLDPEIVEQFQGKPKLVSSDEGARMMLYLAANEGALLLQEGMVLRESDLDVMSILGYGFPAQFGGLMYWARHHVGWPSIVSALRSWHLQHQLSLFEAANWAKQQSK